MRSLLAPIYNLAIFLSFIGIFAFQVVMHNIVGSTTTGINVQKLLNMRFILFFESNLILVEFLSIFSLILFIALLIKRKQVLYLVLNSHNEYRFFSSGSITKKNTAVSVKPADNSRMTIRVPSNEHKPNSSTKSNKILTIKDLERELDSIVGLNNVKNTIKQIYATVKAEAIRRKGDSTNREPMSFHMVFKGNPGTGKTTVARLVGKMFADMEILSKGTFVEADQSTLVTENVGGTPMKVKSIIDKAIGGVLFIDEAYSLTETTYANSSGHGKEAINTLVKYMEDYRGDLCVVVAGYDKPMEKFLKSNEGLASRFPFTLEFEDYTIDQLLQILKLEAKKRKFNLEPDVFNVMKNRLKYIDIGKEGNGRLIRNVLEDAIRKHDLRLEVNQLQHNMEEQKVLRGIDFQ